MLRVAALCTRHAFEASKAIEVCQTTVNFENTIHFIMRRGVDVNPVAGRNVAASAAMLLNLTLRF